MVPTLKIDRDALKDNGFINGYIKDELRDISYDDCVYLLFNPKDLDKFREFLDSEYERTKSIIDDYDYEDGFVVVVYKLDSNFSKDFELIKQGKYSKTSKKFQTLFPKVIKVIRNGLHKDEISLQYRIFNKTEDLINFWEESLDVQFDKDQEIWYGFEEKNETLNVEKLKNYVKQ
jgi:hypothetical protein